MSSSAEVFYVGEGNTDLIVLRAILATLDPAIEVTQLQPITDGTDEEARGRGEGWRGVKLWCESGFEAWARLNPRGVLVMHLDAAIAKGAGVACECPPAAASVDALRAYVLGEWLRLGASPKQLVWMIPAQETELWVWQALYPDEVAKEAHPECVEQPHERLRNRKPHKLMRRDGARWRKLGPRYRAISADITGAWPQVVEKVAEARRFDGALRAALGVV
jgi:hypothetical protein